MAVLLGWLSTIIGYGLDGCGLIPPRAGLSLFIAVSINTVGPTHYPFLCVPLCSLLVTRVSGAWIWKFTFIYGQAELPFASLFFFLKRKFIRSPFGRPLCVFACAGPAVASLLPQTTRNSTLHPLSVTNRPVLITHQN